MNKKNNFALSQEGRFITAPVDYSMTGVRPTVVNVVSDEAAVFRGTQNLRDVVHAALSTAHTPPSDALLYSAAAAIQRQQKATETDGEWAERLSKTFFDGLNGRS